LSEAIESGRRDPVAVGALRSCGPIVAPGRQRERDMTERLVIVEDPAAGAAIARTGSPHAERCPSRLAAGRLGDDRRLDTVTIYRRLKRAAA